jgi:hypothetical protein
MTRQDGIKWWPTATVEKYDAGTVRDIAAHLGITVPEVGGRELDFMRLHEGLIPDDILVVEGNALVAAGKTRIADLIIGTGQAFTQTRGVIGVGTSSTAVTGSETALLGTAYYKGLDQAPGNTAGVISARSTFNAGEAEHAWSEWCWAIATAAVVPSTSFTTATTTGVMLNRKVESLGTKGAGAVWTLSASITIS